MEGGPLQQDDFVTFSKDYVLLCHITSMIEGEKHGRLLQEKGGRGFPYLVFMDDEGNVVAPHNGSRDAAGFTETGKKAGAYLATKKKAEGGDAAAKRELFIARLDLGMIKTPAEAQAEMAGLDGLTDEDKKKIEPMIYELEVGQTLMGIGRGDRAGFATAGKNFYADFKAGKTPRPDSRFYPTFLLAIIEHARTTKDAEAFEAALTKLDEKFSSQQGARQTLDQLKKELEGMKK